MDLRYELDKRATFTGLRVARLVPRWLAYWCFVRIVADVSTGPLAHQAMPEITVTDALEAWRP
jgi:hypothetical protein